MTILNWWYQALQSPLGIEIVCSDPEAVRAKLYTVRRESADPALSRVAVCVSPYNEQNLWLVKRDPYAQTGSTGD